MKYTFIVLLEFYPKWLKLSRKVRNEQAKKLLSIIDRYPAISVRFFDAEAFPGANYTDFTICETTDLAAYHFMWEEIRDTDLYAESYFKIKEVIFGIEDAFKEFEKQKLPLAT
ncbi:darcynin family protein [Enterococcus sp. AZ192]|uniref:darcynin family protein n=1 Tax=unclassified Enterococcus TaxID=2608891 RepID=UPI003D2C7F29